MTDTCSWADVGTLKTMPYESTDKENWTWKITYMHTTCEEMLLYDAWQHISRVEHQGVAGRYNKVYVIIWAGLEDGGEARYMWTAVEQFT